jgi:hypothetical protein
MKDGAGCHRYHKDNQRIDFVILLFLLLTFFYSLALVLHGC